MFIYKKIQKSKEIIHQAENKWDKKKIVVAWTGGKDSTVLLHLIRECFDGKVPFKVMFNDSTIEFPEIYEFVKKITKEWKLDLLHIKHLPEDLEAYKRAKSKEEKMQIMRIAKINAINFVENKYKFTAFMSGIRWDEHESRSKEKYFSPRLNHTRVHPILDFEFNDIWEYIKMHKVPYVNLYDKGYKSLGEKPFTKPTKNPDDHERAGREATKEKVMKQLRKLGYW